MKIGKKKNAKNSIEKEKNHLFCSGSRIPSQIVKLKKGAPLHLPFRIPFLLSDYNIFFFNRHLLKAYIIIESISFSRWFVFFLTSERMRKGKSLWVFLNVCSFPRREYLIFFFLFLFSCHLFTSPHTASVYSNPDTEHTKASNEASFGQRLSGKWEANTLLSVSVTCRF